ncbi:hypothetical protein M0R04_08030 [Candidatus Dojkabacteria bacterium]|jgi:hypothetical protein|nr:hypothetical protein [Candidatus Dojkabacteria bacterium]
MTDCLQNRTVVSNAITTKLLTDANKSPEASAFLVSKLKEASSYENMIKMSKTTDIRDDLKIKLEHTQIELNNYAMSLVTGNPIYKKQLLESF